MKARNKELVDVFRWNGHEIEKPRWAVQALDAGILTIPSEDEYGRKLLGIWYRGSIAIAYPGYYIMKSEEGEISALPPERFNRSYEVIEEEHYGNN